MIDHAEKFFYADVDCQMKTKWADNSKDFLKNLLRNLDLVDVNF